MKEKNGEKENDLDAGYKRFLSPTCHHCIHLSRKLAHSCAAFPGEDTIPEDIWNGYINHDHPYPGDHGIQFESKNKTKAY